MKAQVVRAGYTSAPMPIEEAQTLLQAMKKNAETAVLCMPIIIKDADTGEELEKYAPRHVWTCIGNGTSSGAMDEHGSSEEYARAVSFPVACTALVKSGLPFRYVTIEDSQTGEVLETYDKNSGIPAPEITEWDFGDKKEPS